MAVNIVTYRENLSQGRVRTVASSHANQINYRQLQVDPKNIELLLKFDGELNVKGLTENTRRGYLYAVGKFLEYLGDKDVRKTNRDDVIGFITVSKTQGLKNSTVTTLFIHATKFLAWLNEGKMPPFLHDLRPKRNNHIKLPEEILTPEEVLKIRNTATNSRDKALVSVLFETAARASEFLGLRIKDIEFNDYGAKVRLNGKTGERVIPLVDSVPDIKTWLNDHPNKNKKDSFVWVEIHENRSWNFGRPLQHNGLYGTLHRLSRLAKTTKNAHPHIFRHSRLTVLARQVPESVLRKFAGWTASSNMPEIYVHLNGSDVENTILSRVYGKIAEEKLSDPMKPVCCKRCNTENPKDNDFCYQCQQPLNLKSIENVEKVKEIISGLVLEVLSKGSSKETLGDAVKRLKEGQ